MSLEEFQRALVDLTLNPRLAVRLIRGELNGMDNFSLTERESRRIVDIVKQRGMSVSCSLARGNRFEPIGEIFPMTCILLEPVLRDLLDELWQEARPMNYQFSGEEESFAQMIRSKISSGHLFIEYLEEIFNYEWACWQLARQMRAQTDFDHEAAMIIEFKHPPDQLLPPLSELTLPPTGLPEGTYKARITLRGNRFYVTAVSDAAESKQLA
jgi:hypothetical protein